MPTPSSLPAGLAFLSDWLNPCRDAAALDALFGGWVRASGWQAAGVVWRGELASRHNLTARPDRVDHGSPTPGVWPDLGDEPASDATDRLRVLLSPPGREPGYLWAERQAAQPWTDADTAFLKLSARLIERSPALTTLLGPAVDPERLAQRLADAALISGRMAHEFDNVLTGIIGFSDLALPLIPAGSQAAKYVGEISKVGQRGIVFTTQLHELSRSGHAKPQPGSVAVACATQQVKLAALAPAVQLTSDLAAGLPGVAMEAGPLGVVLGHLLANAAEAMPTGGRVHVSAAMVEVSAAETRGYLGTVRPGPYVRVTVRDAGPGIKPEVRGKLFNDPFFTTKVRHRGLGLAVVYRVLSAHRGGVRIEPPSATEPGTTVRVVLPPAGLRPSPTPPTARPSTLLGK